MMDFLVNQLPGKRFILWLIHAWKKDRKQVGMPCKAWPYLYERDTSRHSCQQSVSCRGNLLPALVDVVKAVDPVEVAFPERRRKFTCRRGPQEVSFQVPCQGSLPFLDVGEARPLVPRVEETPHA